MSSFMTRWSVLQTHDVGATDVDAHGVVTDAALTRWLDGARDEYLDQVARVQAACAGGLTLQLQRGDLPAGGVLGRPTSVAVSASATEVFPTRFVIALRLHATDGESDGLINTECVVALADPTTGEAQPLGAEIRDELIALEHSARHFN